MENQNSKSPFSWIALIGVIVVVLAIAAGFLYLRETLPAPASIEDERVVEGLDTQSDSTDPSSIEADLDAQSPDSFEAELDESFNELDATLQ